MTETVLIVDDGSSHLRMAEYTIGQKLGYHVITADGGDEAIRWIMTGREPQPDLILLDLPASGVNGLRVLYEVKACRPQLPVIMLTPYGDDEQVAQAAQMGVDDALSKPVTLDRLRFSLRNVFTIHRLKRTVARLERRIAGDEREISMPQGDALPGELPAFFDEAGRVKKLKSIEEEIIRLALRHTGGCMTRAARQLGIGRSTLYRRVNDLGIDGYISRANQAMRPMMTVSSAERS